MDGIEFTNVLGILLSDAGWRAALRHDRNETARRLKLREQDRAAFQALDVEQLELQAQTLVNKRLGEVRRLLPETFALLGPIADQTFREYADTNWPKGHDRHRSDALAFCRFIDSRNRRQLCRSEFNRLAFAGAHARWAIHWLCDWRGSGRRKHAVQILYRNRRSRVREWFVFLEL